MCRICVKLPAACYAQTGKAHRRHRDVIFGKKAIEIIANKLPDSYRMYLTRHNDELKKNAQAIRLAQARAK
jgi:hypothetical protein